jgi:hypothetical protein
MQFNTALQIVPLIPDDIACFLKLPMADVGSIAEAIHTIQHAREQKPYPLLESCLIVIVP